MIIILTSTSWVCTYVSDSKHFNSMCPFTYVGNGWTPEICYIQTVRPFTKDRILIWIVRANIMYTATDKLVSVDCAINQISYFSR